MSTTDDGTGSDTAPTSVVVTGPTADAVTVQVSGDITTDAVDKVAQAFDTALTASDRAIVVDMTEVTHLSLEGAATLVTLTRRCGDHGRVLRVHTSPAVRRKLTLTGLDTVIPLAQP